MAENCKVCGEEMELKVGEHYRDTGRGRVLYTDVHQYVCPRGCPGAFFDYRYARPVGTPERLLGVVPVPRRPVDIVGPVLSVGLFLAYVLFLVGIFLTTAGLLHKVVAAVVMTLLAGALVRFMRTPASESDGDAA